MSALYQIALPDVTKGETWDGLTWVVSDVPDGETEFSDTLALATVEFKDCNGNTVLTLSSATSGQVTINVSTADAWSVTAEPQTLNLPAGNYTWKLWTTDSSGRRKTRIGGVQQITED